MTIIGRYEWVNEVITYFVNYIIKYYHVEYPLLHYDVMTPTI